MVARSNVNSAGWVAIATSLLLGASLATGWGAPASTHPNAVLAWHAQNSLILQARAVLWLFAMLGLVAFAISLREALWATVLDRAWMTIVFVQGAVVFATVAVVSSAIGWALAEQAGAGTISADLATAVWAVQRTLMRFAAWGFIVPLLVAGVTLYRHSVLGQLCTVSAVFIAGAILVPLTMSIALAATAGWLMLTGVTLLVPTQTRDRRTELVS